MKGPPTVFGTFAIRTLISRKAAAFVPVSRAVAERSGLSRDPQVTVLPAFIADDLEHQADASAGYLRDLPDVPFILFVGQLGRHKGVHVLLEAYAGLNSAPPLVLIGARKPDTPTDLPPNVRMLHNWPHAAVLEAWRRSLFGVVPSVWPEPFGIVTLEAMAFGRPVVATRGGGVLDCVTDGETGLLVEPGDVSGLRAALQRLLDEPDLRTKMGQHARERSFDFRASAVVPRIEAVYRRVLASGGR